MKVGYVLKKFPRLSETFILNEMLALESLDVAIEVFSLKAPDEEPRHGALQRLRAPVTLLEPLAPRSIFRFLEEEWRRGTEDARERLAYFYDRLDARDPWRPAALGYSLALAPMIRERGVDHLHAHFGTVAASTAAETARLTGLPFSFTMHAKDIYRRGVPFDLLGERMNEAAFTVTVCEANATWLRERCGPAACARLRVLYNGLDLSEWRYHPSREPGTRFLAVGRLIQKKGFDDFLRACAIARQAGRSFQALLIGSGEEGETLGRLRSELGLESCLGFAAMLPQEEVRAEMARSTLLVAPCVEASDGNRDALPTVLIEAMALGTPCLATTIGGIPEMIADGLEGWLVAPRSPSDLARVMMEAMDNPAETRLRGEAARRRVERQFDLGKNVRLLGEAFGIHPAGNPSPPAAVPSRVGSLA